MFCKLCDNPPCSCKLLLHYLLLKIWFFTMTDCFSDSCDSVFLLSIVRWPSSSTNCMNYRLASGSFFKSINPIGIFLIFAEDDKWLWFPYNPWAAAGKYQSHVLGLVQRAHSLTAPATYLILCSLYCKHKSKKLNKIRRQCWSKVNWNRLYHILGANS